MKKRILAALLTLWILCPSVGAVGEYAEFGNVDNWTEQQWEQANDWTEQQWNDYWAEYDAAMQAWQEETASWTEEQWREYDKAQKLQRIGAPYQDGINVQLDADFLTFGDVRPIMMDGRVMLPMRAFLEALGADRIGYDAQTRQVTAMVDGISLTMTVGERTVHIQRPDMDKPGAKTLDAAPWLDEQAGRVYLPLRAVSDCLGYAVLWDDTCDVVRIVRTEKLIEDIDSRFAIFNRYLAERMPKEGVTLQHDIQATVDGVLYKDEGQDTLRLQADVQMLENGKSASARGSFSVDGSDFADIPLVQQLVQEISQEVLKVWQDGSVPAELIWNGKEIFVNSPVMTLEQGGDPTQEVWYYVEDGTELPLQLLRDGRTVGRRICDAAVTARVQNDQGYVDVYAEATQQADRWAAYIGDSLFTRTGTGWQLTLDGVQMGEIISIYDLVGWAGGAPASWTVELREIGGKLCEMQMRYLCEDSLYGVDVSLQDTRQGTQLQATLKGRYLGKIVMDCKDTVRETQQAIPTQPPAGEEIVNAENGLPFQRVSPS